MYGWTEAPKQKLRNYKPFWRVYSQFESVVSPSSNQKLRNYKQFWNLLSGFELVVALPSKNYETTSRFDMCIVNLNR